MTKLKFNKEKHEYTFDAVKLESVSTFLKRFENPFDSDYWSKHIAKRDGISQKEVLQDWEINNKNSRDHGTKIHLMGENIALKKLNRPIITKAMPDSFREKTDLVCMENFWNREEYSPVEVEMRVYSLKYMLAGTFDLLAMKDDSLYLLDYKTNKAIKRFNQYGEKLKNPIRHLDNCEYNKYSLQLTLYKRLLEESSDYKIDGMHLVHIRDGKYKMIRCKNMKAEIDMMLTIRDGEINDK